MAITKAISVSTEFFSMIDSTTVSTDGLTDEDVSSQDDIFLRHIWFSYPTRRNVQVLKGFNARFSKGKTTALVGPSGSGKSTIVALLERWYDLKDQSNLAINASQIQDSESKQEIVADNRGGISIGTHDISNTNVKWWRSQIGLVQQEPFLFNDTILNNVAFGLLGTQWENDDDASKKVRVEKACKEAFADEFVQQLPEVRLAAYQVM